MGGGTGGEAAISVAALADAGYTVDMTKAGPLRSEGDHHQASYEQTLRPR